MFKKMITLSFSLSLALLVCSSFDIQLRASVFENDEIEAALKLFNNYLEVDKQLPINFNQSQLDRAFRFASRKVHPDKNPENYASANEAFQKLNNANMFVIKEINEA